MSKVSDLVLGRKDEFLTRVLLATALFAEKFYNGREIPWGKATSEVAQRAEAQLNDPNEYVSSDFVATIKALTGETIQPRAPWQVSFQVGVAVVPVAPLYGKRTEDGYTIGEAYLCVNETSGGKFRNANNSAARMTTGKSNAVGIMSHLSDEVRPATEEEIAALVDGLFEVKALSLLHDLEPELHRYDAFIK